MYVCCFCFFKNIFVFLSMYVTIHFLTIHIYIYIYVNEYVKIDLFSYLLNLSLFIVCVCSNVFMGYAFLLLAPFYMFVCLSLKLNIFELYSTRKVIFDARHTVCENMCCNWQCHHSYPFSFISGLACRIHSSLLLYIYIYYLFLFIYINIFKEIKRDIDI